MIRSPSRGFPTDVPPLSMRPAFRLLITHTDQSNHSASTAKAQILIDSDLEYKKDPPPNLRSDDGPKKVEPGVGYQEPGAEPFFGINPGASDVASRLLGCQLGSESPGD